MLALDDIPKAVAGVKQLRPTIPKRFPPSLVSYLTNMWAADPKLRPTFVQVLVRPDLLTESLPRVALFAGMMHPVATPGCCSDCCTRLL